MDYGDIPDDVLERLTSSMKYLEELRINGEYEIQNEAIRFNDLDKGGVGVGGMDQREKSNDYIDCDVFYIMRNWKMLILMFCLFLLLTFFYSFMKMEHLLIFFSYLYYTCLFHDSLLMHLLKLLGSELLVYFFEAGPLHCAFNTRRRL